LSSNLTNKVQPNEFCFSLLCVSSGICPTSRSLTAYKYIFYSAAKDDSRRVRTVTHRFVGDAAGKECQRCCLRHTLHGSRNRAVLSVIQINSIR
jgi:hypothetical protein